MVDVQKEFSILIADDEKMNVDMLGGILSPMYNLLVSRNGSRAVELAKEHTPDLILLDVLMPDMTGFEVIKILKGDEKTVNIPVIFITGLSSAEDEARGFALGAVDYITKPFNKAVVKARVNTHLRIVDQMRIIKNIGLIDPLTKIANRRGFENRLTVEWSRAIRDQTPLSLLMMDIDMFKNYNDTNGHLQGDMALKTFVEVSVNSLMRDIDFIARWGGEEFVILLPGTAENGAIQIAERVRSNVEALSIPSDEGDDTRITVSIGVITVVPNMNSSITDFIKKADKALYKAKETGRNRFVVA